MSFDILCDDVLVLICEHLRNEENWLMSQTSRRMRAICANVYRRRFPTTSRLNLKFTPGGKRIVWPCNPVYFLTHVSLARVYAVRIHTEVDIKLDIKLAYISQNLINRACKINRDSTVLLYPTARK